jgi:hypothetical protein
MLYAFLTCVAICSCTLCQEHVVGMVVKLLSASLPSDSATSTPGSMSNYLAHMSTLNEILLGVSYGDAIHILSLYGMVIITAI